MKNNTCSPTFFNELSGGLLEYAYCKCESSDCKSFNKIVYGASASYYKEPIDQIVPFLISADLQRYKSESELLIYAAWRFGVLNTRAKESIKKKWVRLFTSGIRKQIFHYNLMNFFGIRGNAVLTDNFWEDPLQWRMTEGVLAHTPRILPNRNPFAGRYKRFSEMPKPIFRGIDAEFFRQIADIETPKLYSLLEAAQIKYLNLNLGVDSKIGPISENEFDQWTSDFVHIAHFRQPVDILTNKDKIKTLIPYIGKSTEQRIFFEDDKEKVLEKLKIAENACSNDPAEYYDPKTQSNVLNPVVQYAVYAVEALRLKRGESATIAGNTVECGLDVIKLANEKTVKGWTPDVAELLWDNVVFPINDAMMNRYRVDEVLKDAEEACVTPETETEYTESLVAKLKKM